MKKQMLLYQSPSSGNKSLSVNQMLPSMCPLNRNSCLSLPKKTPLSLLLWWPLKVIFFQVPFRGYDCVLRKSGVSPDWPIRTNEISRMDLASMFTLSYLNHLFFPLLNHSFSNTSFLKKTNKKPPPFTLRSPPAATTFFCTSSQQNFWKSWCHLCGLISALLV